MDPDARVVLVQHLGLVGVGPTLAAASLARDLYHRAMAVMAGAHAIDRFVSLTPAESFAVEYWPLELYKLSLAPAPRELQGRCRARDRRVPAASAARSSTRSPSSGRPSRPSTSTAPARRPRSPTWATQVSRWQGDVTSEEAVAEAFRATAERFGGVDIVISNAGVASSAAIEETTLADPGTAATRSSARGYFLVAREAFRLLRGAGRSGGSVVFVGVQERARGRPRNAAAYSSAKAAELHLARCLAEEGGAAGIRVNSVNPDAVLQGSGIWDSSWREERAAAYGIAPDALEEHYRKRTTLGASTSCPRTSLRPSCTSPRERVRQERGEHPQRRWRRAGGVQSLVS